MFADDTVDLASSQGDLQLVPERVAAKCEAAGAEASQSRTRVKEGSRRRGGGWGLVQTPGALLPSLLQTPRRDYISHLSPGWLL